MTIGFESRHHERFPRQLNRAHVLAQPVSHVAILFAELKADARPRFASTQNHFNGFWRMDYSFCLKIPSTVDASAPPKTFLYQSEDVAAPCSRAIIILSAMSRGRPYFPVSSL